MGEKKNKNNGNGGEKKKEENPITVVLKMDLHCEGCVTKIIKTIKGFDGVENAKAELATNKLTVVGNVEPAKLREFLAEKKGKKVDLISPQPNKKDDNKNDNNNAKNDNNKKKQPDEANKKKPDDKKPKEKEAPVTTAVLKLPLHCGGCIQKIRKIVTKTKGFKDISIDKQKELVTVLGSMDMKALAETLQEKLKTPVQIVPPKKEKEGGGDKDSGKGDNGGGGGGKKKGGGGGDGGKKADADGGNMEEMLRMDPYLGQPAFGNGYGYGQMPMPMPMAGPGFGYGYPPGYWGEHAHPPQMFSDENPNACSVM